MKIITIVGARPQFIKAAVLHQKLKEKSDIQEVMIHTGQHYDPEMSANFFTELNMQEPAYNLGINNLSHAVMTGRMLEAIDPILESEKPDLLVVYGDTNSTLAGALAAKKLSIPVAHVEAGLRSGDMKMPEEMNRLLTDRISDLLFCPTTAAVNNLIREGFSANQLHMVGDIMYDASITFSEVDEQTQPVLQPPYVLCTFHRQQLMQSKEKMSSLLQSLVILNKEIPVVLIAHPRTAALIHSLQIQLPFKLEGPLGYAQMAAALKRASLVITDSGGLQKEAYFFGKYCITVRNSTEWTELVDAGVNFLAGDDGNNILSLYQKIKSTDGNFSIPFYGDGNASGRIVETIQKFINERQVR